MTNEADRSEYLGKLQVPSEGIIARISRVQLAKEKEIQEKYRTADGNRADTEREEAAAGTIQRTYRGYRQRKHLRDHGLDPSTRWIEALKEARFRALTAPQPRRSTSLDTTSSPSSIRSRALSEARQKWRRIKEIAQRARGDPSSASSSTSSSSSSHSSDTITRTSHLHLFHKRQRRPPRPWNGKILDLSYFLELVDLKHRYGTNLKAYHAEWKEAPTTENFFYWLDHGEGKRVNLTECPREKLEREQVRYLSREERMNYLVKVDNGLLVWTKSGNPVDTREKGWKNSVNGIVPIDDPTPSLATKAVNSDWPLDAHELENQHDENERRNNYAASPRRKHRKRLKKLLHITPSTIAEHLLRASITENTWIFVFTPSHHLYISLKTAGTFQHSSFLHGSRISAAGILSVSNGRLLSLSPLSGHYRPPAAAFRHFLTWLEGKGMDMRGVQVSKLYWVLEGLEAWVGLKGVVKGLVRGRRRGRRAVGSGNGNAGRRRDSQGGVRRENADVEMEGVKGRLKDVKKDVREGDREEKEESEQEGATTVDALGPQVAETASHRRNVIDD